ncbi:flagellar biosynthesis [Micractinium conductrix]|uniref:Flagellar biosynthesis n=1 Tax=Micractinium conductrix TaxID=554055 RepID=A0A2P6V790_9CHLO|nr:flagellar biosynthesis [Micractinium conductrix]|eukprot:PSC69957.1 flagellar biosynthesis [Micractinium conductrix]
MTVRGQPDDANGSGRPAYWSGSQWQAAWAGAPSRHIFFIGLGGSLADCYPLQRTAFAAKATAHGPHATRLRHFGGAPAHLQVAVAPPFPAHQQQLAAMFRGASYTSDEDDGWLDSVESLKAASASLTLHASASASLLLPCGLLPEELAELEGSAMASTFNVEAAAKAGGALTLTLAADELDSLPSGPLTPMGKGEVLVFSETSDEDEGPAVAGDGEHRLAGKAAGHAAAS